MKNIDKDDIQSPENDEVGDYLDWVGNGPGMVHPDVESRMIELHRNLNGMALCEY